ncbi:GNAT family N-acetyltransferase [Kitasatospora acidiphila]|uniref:GNAT family N-acetyltransferase n=1 Tax=Kitasatospora acidiphila TaxID=2567942 RepID=A0A540W6U8_9ACTN|nr:GNAT family N-acetyltransferase [Kitasatospora acidiphila]TQF04703.1 GNAT family N-acetyltransferase [Kitasatospora acidiphila]
MSEEVAPTDGIEIRSITEGELGAWGDAVSRGFQRAGMPEALEFRRLRNYPGRTLGAFERDKIVGTLRSFPNELTVPGGALLPVSAISGVTVRQTHRRRGLLNRMMARELAGARERGEAAAILVAAEYGIYRRYGFGPATRADGLVVNLHHAEGLRADLPESAGRLDLVSMAELAKYGPELHECWRRSRPGAIGRDEAFWREATGTIEMPGPERKEPFAVVHRDAGGTVTGLLVYSVTDQWDGPNPDCVLTVHDFLALDTVTAVALWRYACSMDWVRSVSIASLAPDDPLPLLLNNPRAARPHPEQWDHTWLRVLDVPAAFGARTYAGPGRVVLDVTDRQGYASGRWLLQADVTGAGTAEPTSEEPDLAIDAAVLGSLYLGAESATRLAAAAQLTELRPGAAFATDRLLGTPLKAYNPDTF